MFLVALAATKAAALYEGCRKDEIRELEENVRTSCPEYHFQFEFPFHLVLEGTIKTDMFCARAVEGLAHLVGGYACSDSDVKRQAPHLLELRKMSQTLQSTRLSSSAPTLGAPRFPFMGRRGKNAVNNQNGVVKKGKKFDKKKMQRHAKKAGNMIKNAGDFTDTATDLVCDGLKIAFELISSWPPLDPDTVTEDELKDRNRQLNKARRTFQKVGAGCTAVKSMKKLVRREAKNLKTARAKRQAKKNAAQNPLESSAHREGETRRRANGRAHDSDNDRDYLRLGDEMDAEEEFFGTDAARWDYEF